MKTRLIAVLLASTCLTTPARAEPVSLAVAAFISGATGGALFVGAGISAQIIGGFAGAAFTVGSFLGTTFLGRALVGLAISAALAPKAPSIPPPGARMSNFAQPISYAEYVFGRTRKGGPLGFTGAQNSRRYYVPILAAHEIEGVVEHWIDEWTVGVDDTITDVDVGNLLTSEDNPIYTAPSVGGRVAEKGRIDFFTGDPGQTANAGLVSAFSEITALHDFAGLAGAVVWARKAAADNFSEIYPRGRQWAYTAVIDGWNQIYDPRDESTSYTNNAALVIAHWIVEILGQEVDWDQVAEESDACDVTVTDPEGTELPKWTINGVLRDDQSFEEQRDQLGGACDAFFYERPDGKVGFRVGRWIAPTVTLTAADFLECQVSAGQWGANAPTEMATIYTEPANAWRETSSGVWVEDAGARRVREEPQLYMITNHTQASRINKRRAKARRAEWQMTGTIGLIGMELIGQRFFSLDHEGLGVTIDMEVRSLTRRGPALFEVEAISVAEADFDFDAATEEPEQPVFKSADSDFTSQPLTGFTAAPASGAVINVAWDDQEDWLAQQVRYREVGETEWQILTFSGQTVGTISGLTDGTTYEVQGRNVNEVLNSNPSDWTPDPALEVTAVANPTAPDALDDFSLSAAGSDITVSFTAPNDPNYFGTRIWRGTSTTFSAASLVRTEYGIPSSGDSWTDTGLAPGLYYYWAAPINGSGVEGPLSGPLSETVI